MKLNFNPITITSIPQKQNNTSIKYRYSLQKDTVSFSGKDNGLANPAIKLGSEFGNKIMRQSEISDIKLDDLREYVNQKMPDVSVLPIEELRNYESNWADYEAFYYTNFKDDFTFSDKILFLRDCPKGDKMTRLLYASTCAHEFTHAAQDLNKDRYINFLKDVTGSDPSKVKLFMGPAEALFQFFDNDVQAMCGYPVIKRTTTRVDVERYGHYIPKENKVTQKDVFSGLEAKNEREFQEIFNGIFDAVSDKVITQMTYQYPDLIADVPYINEPEKLKKYLKQYLAMKAHDEFEAYTTESLLAKKVLGKKDLNIDVFPIYYQQMEKALLA